MSGQLLLEDETELVTEDDLQMLSEDGEYTSATRVRFALTITKLTEA